MEPLEGSKQRNETRAFGFRKLILMGRVKKKKNRWIRWGPNAKQRDELEVRLLRSWWGIKGGLSSSRGSRERHGGQIPEIQKTARIETGKWLNEVGVGVREGSLLWPSSSLFEQTEMELTGTRNTRLYGVRELRPGWGVGGQHPGTETTDEMSTHSLSSPSSQVLGHQNRDWKFLCVFW